MSHHTGVHVCVNRFRPFSNFFVAVLVLNNVPALSSLPSNTSIPLYAEVGAYAEVGVRNLDDRPRGHLSPERPRMIRSEGGSGARFTDQDSKAHESWKREVQGAAKSESQSESEEDSTSTGGQQQEDSTDNGRERQEDSTDNGREQQEDCTDNGRERQEDFMDNGREQEDNGREQQESGHNGREHVSVHHHKHKRKVLRPEPVHEEPKQTSPRGDSWQSQGTWRSPPTYEGHRRGAGEREGDGATLHGTKLNRHRHIELASNRKDAVPVELGRPVPSSKSSNEDLRQVPNRVDHASSAGAEDSTRSASSSAPPVEMLSPQHILTMQQATDAATSAAVTAAQVAAALPASLPEGVRQAALEAAATAAVQASLQGGGSPAQSSHDNSVDKVENAHNVEQSQDHDMSSGPKRTLLGEQDAPSKQMLDLQQDTEDKQELFTSRTVVQNSVQDLADLASTPDDMDDLASTSKVNPPQLKDVDDHASTPKEDRLLYIGIFSKPEDTAGRLAARTSWVADLQKLYPDSNRILVQFIIGRQPPSKVAALSNHSMVETGTGVYESGDAEQAQLDVRLGQEFKQYGDLFHIPYEELPVKVLMYFAHAVEMRYRFVMKVDLDQELLYRPLIESLKNEKLDKLLYAGQTLRDVSLLEAKAKRGKENKVERFFSGPCYLASWSLAQRFSKEHLDHSIMLWSYNTEGSDVDDMDMGQWVAYEDKLLAQLAKEKSQLVEEDEVEVQRVDNRIMDMCRKPLPRVHPADETPESTESTKQSGD
jgi:hypothetical protein